MLHFVKVVINPSGCCKCQGRANLSDCWATSRGQERTL